MYGSVTNAVPLLNGFACQSATQALCLGIARKSGETLELIGVKVFEPAIQ